MAFRSRDQLRSCASRGPRKSLADVKAEIGSCTAQPSGGVLLLL